MDAREQAEGPVEGPILTAEQRVAPEWIDYNGHMNVAYYVMAFDRALDEVYDDLDIGPRAAREEGMGPMALQSQIHYLAELLEGEAFRCEVLILDADAKRVHVFCRMLKDGPAGEATVAATYESLTLNVDLTERRSAPFPEAVGARLARLREAHARLPRPPQVGAPLGIRRKA